MIKVNLLCVLLLFLWQKSTNAREKYGNIAKSETTLDPNSTLKLAWQVDYQLRKIRFHLIPSERSPRYTWFALGFSDRGELADADLCVFWTDYNGDHHFEDMHTNSEETLVYDVNQNCDQFYYDEDTKSISFERYFDTCDDEDYVIEDGTVHVVWAIGADETPTPEDLCLSCTSSRHKGTTMARLLTPPIRPVALEDSKELRVTAGGIKVPNKDTTYFCKVMVQPEILSEKVHYITQFEATVSPGNEGLVHHMKVIYCDTDEDLPLYEGDCSLPEFHETKLKCSRIKAAWAMGALPFVYPEEAALPIGGPNLNKYLMLEVHYNNPELRSDWVDDSGIVLHITENRRKYDAAMLQVGVEYTDRVAIPGEQTAFPWTGYCTPECSGITLPEDGILVFASQLHTHLTGRAVWTRHSRHGIELPMLNKDMHFSTHFQEIRLLHRPVRVLPGDALETTCIFSTVGKRNATVGGDAIADEMCINYMYYYPATQLEVCKSAVSVQALRNYFDQERRSNKMVNPSNSPRSNYLAMTPWTKEMATNLHKMYDQSPMYVQCSKPDGSQFEGQWNEVLAPRIDFPLPEEPRICTFV